ncbi:MAG: response regulator [Gemmataceae bacterium]
MTTFPTTPPPAGPPCARRTILVVDDDPLVLDITERLLRSLDCDVVPARDGEEALRLFLARRGGIDLALVDLTMPRMGGEEILRQLRRLSPDLPLVLMSGYPTHEAIHRLEGVELAGCLQKPFRLGALSDMLPLAVGG